MAFVGEEGCARDESKEIYSVTFTKMSWVAKEKAIPTFQITVIMSIGQINE